MDGVSTRKKGWVLTQEAFDRLLARLDDDRERAGKAYEEARRKLVKFFEWNGSGSPEEHADETINRVARKVNEGEEIRNVRGYFGGVARLLLLEIYKEREYERGAIESLPPPSRITEEDDHGEPRRECFERCLESLPRESRELIVEYYREEKGAKIELRKGLAARLDIPLNALRIRAHRIRARLEECVHECLEQQADAGR
jgi:DNA-directed RNA polymerase specialized sigma24 family protein